MNRIFCNICKKMRFHIVKKEPWWERFFSDVDTVGALVKRIFPFREMKYFSNSNPVSCCDNCSFIIFPIIFSTNLLGANIKRIVSPL